MDAVGTKLAHDVTEIRPGEFKGPRPFIRATPSVMRTSVVFSDWENNPREGKINLLAARDGLLRVDAAALATFNMVDEVMCATLQSHTLVQKGDLVAATRAIPLVMKRAPIERVATIAAQNDGVVSVRPLRKVRAGLVITGNEVYHGMIEDRFAPVLTKKIIDLGAEVVRTEFAPDDAEWIQRTILGHLENGCNLLLLSGGMSVDPDDVTRKGIRTAGADEIYYGASALPGAMFLVAYIGNIPVLGVPACGLHHRVERLTRPSYIMGLQEAGGTSLITILPAKPEDLGLIAAPKKVINTNLDKIRITASGIMAASVIAGAMYSYAQKTQHLDHEPDE